MDPLPARIRAVAGTRLGPGGVAARTLALIAIALVLGTCGAACTTDEERVPPDAGPIARRDAAVPDAGPSQLCGGLGAACCTEPPACRVDWTYCATATTTCSPCGDLAQVCCREGPACRGAFLCTAGLCGP